MQYNKERSINFYFIILILFSHLFCINFHSVNHEYLSYDFLIYLDTNQVNVFDYLKKTNNSYYLENYFSQQANTFGFTLLIYFFSKIFFLDYLVAAKLLSAFGLILLYLGIKNLFRVNNFKKINYIYILIIILNPVIWIFSFRAYGDIISSGIAFYAFSNLLLQKKFHKFFFLMLGISIIIKPICGIYVIAYNIYKFINKNKIKYILYENLVIFILPIIFFSINYKIFNFFLFPESGAVEQHKIFTIKYFLVQLIFYFGTFFLILFPLWHLKFLKVFQGKDLLIITIFLFIVYHLSKDSLLLIFNNSELNLGPLSNYINDEYLIILLFFLSTFFFLLIKSLYKSLKNNLNKTILFTIIIYLVILSFLKPVQKYLIPIIPLIYFLIYDFIKDNKTNYIYFFLSLILFFIVNFYLLSNQYINGKISHDVYKFLKKKDLYHLTNTSLIDPHTSFLLDGKSKLKKYYTENNEYELVYDLNKKKCIYIFETKFIYLKKNLCLIKK